MARVLVEGLSGLAEATALLLADFSREFHLDQVVAAPRAPQALSVARLRALQERGVQLAATPPLALELTARGITDLLDLAACQAQCQVRVLTVPPLATDAGPAVVLPSGPLPPLPLLAQDLNDHTLRRGQDTVLHVAPTVAQGVAHVMTALAGRQGSRLAAAQAGHFVVMERGPPLEAAVDVVAGPLFHPVVDEVRGTPHAVCAARLLADVAPDVTLFSGAVELNHPLMHALHFRVRLEHRLDLDQALARLAAHPRVGLTQARSAHPVVGFGRDHGWGGRLLNALVVPTATLSVVEGRDVVGAAWVPDEGTELYSAVAGVLWLLDPTAAAGRLAALRPYLFGELA